MSETDIVKNRLRSEIKAMRRGLDRETKAELDEGVFRNLLKNGEFLKARTVLVYKSTGIEVGTERIIEYCLENNIRTALPRCLENHAMNFYYYDGSTPLEKSAYGIYEPSEDAENEVRDFRGSVCIVPALAFDREGYRLGYGGGYYDRFLARHTEVLPIGICYSENIKERLVRNEFDRKAAYVVTEKNPEANK